MKNIVLCVLVVSFLIVDCILLYKYKMVLAYQDEIQQRLLFVEDENIDFKSIIGYFYQQEGVPILDETCIMDDGNKIRLHEVIKSADKVLIFRYNLSDCSDCVESVFEKLKNIQNVDKLIVISDFKSIHSMSYLKQKYNLPHAVFLKSENSDVSATPCVFCSDENYQMSKFLIINQGDKMLDVYLQQL